MQQGNIIQSFAAPLVAQRQQQNALAGMSMQAEQNGLADLFQQAAQYNALAQNGGPTKQAANALASTAQNSGVNLDGVDPRLVSVINAAMAEAGGGWKITEGMRTQERQAQLYAQGRTAPGKIVTGTMNSQHLKGNALDVALFNGGKADWDFEKYRAFNDVVQRIAAQQGVPVTWGGGWEMRDGSHFQIGG